jgi:hypothetical protein
MPTACRMSVAQSSQPGVLTLRSFSILSHIHPVRQHKFVSVSISPVGHRPFSITSLFPKFKSPAPSPTIVANIARLEAEANTHPHDIPKQVGLFQALVNTQVKAGYDVVISRWERMQEFVCGEFVLDYTRET